ncbi:co-chaperone YbbN [Leptolyngbya sp. 'hensonii']|uniref:tetratricopeptide repeat protein n=1 Tax=Leptolyngbya sp. 'hensonii' TaxID=1922337 RepID=UPI00094FD69D|nr:tetratricopeptide repeat protein [Leptolyngbya sp. 'hensonii']OLP17192.1 co-chaperone YbbN [Leptolyngbya sp. 'hensonii']
MGFSVEVTSNNFDAEVVQRSYEKPVLVDFFAQWCGPCKLLKPMLEKLLQEYDFVLAQVDIDANPDLAQTFGVQGVPDVKIFLQGAVQEGFVGVLPEPQLRELLVKLNLKSDLELGLETLQQTIAAGEVAKVPPLVQSLLEKYPSNRQVLLIGARFLISLNILEPAEKLLALVQADEKDDYIAARGLKGLIHLKRQLAEPPPDDELGQLFFQSLQLTVDEAYEAALELLLQVLTRDRKYGNDAARKTMITIFDLLGDDHPLSKTYRRQMTMALY